MPPSPPPPPEKGSSTPTPAVRVPAVAPDAPKSASPPTSPRTPRPPLESQSTSESITVQPAREAVDMDTFGQILELDEDDTHDFSKEMVDAFFSQASTTFEDMDKAFAAKNLVKLSELGHFLKGSSAALGICHVQATCEKMQHYGELRDEEAGKDLSREQALDKIEVLLGEVKLEYAAAEKWLKDWYATHGMTFDAPPQPAAS